MAQLREDLIGQGIGLYDVDNNNILNIQGAVDITEDCPHKKDPNRKALLLYTTSLRGPIVQITECNEGMNEVLVDTHWHIQLLEDLSQAVCGSFRWYAKEFGLTPELLRQMVRMYQPVQ